MSNTYNKIKDAIINNKPKIQVNEILDFINDNNLFIYKVE
mgnify:CR=1 FL=1